MLHHFSKRAQPDVDLDKVIGRLKTQFTSQKEPPASLAEALGFGQQHEEQPKPARQPVREPRPEPRLNTTGSYTFDLPRALAAIRRNPTGGRRRSET